MKKYLTICGLFFVLFFLLISNINLANAEGFLPTRQTGSGSCSGGENCGNYSLNDMVSVVEIFAQWLLGIVGSLALAMFIYGGVVFLISAGNTEQVKKGKEIILGAIIGLVIVFTSYTIIHFVFKALGIPVGTSWNIIESTGGWFNP